MKKIKKLENWSEVFTVRMTPELRQLTDKLAAHMTLKRGQKHLKRDIIWEAVRLLAKREGLTNEGKKTEP